jgi:CCR4-NOT transcription complex subunit 1
VLQKSLCRCYQRSTEVRQLLAAVPQVVPSNLSEIEKKQAVGFAQGVFRRLYELDLSEPLRLEVLVALLEKMNEANSQLGQDLGTWTTYAPTETEAQRKLHRTVLLLLVRSNLVSPQELDGFLSSSSDNGRNPVWVEFSLLFIRTAFLERIATPSDFPQLMELMTNVADGRSQASLQVAQTLRKPILRMLEEVRGAATADQQPRVAIGVQTVKKVSIEESSMLSSASLTNLKNGARVAALSLESFSRNDHPNAKQQVTSLLDSWIRVHSEAVSNEGALAQYLQLLQQFGVGKTEEQTERFFRLATQIVVDAVMKSSANGVDGKTLNYSVIDIYSHLIPLIFRALSDGDTEEQISTKRIALLNKALGGIVRCMMWDYDNNKKAGNGAWDQRPWFRLLLNMTVDMNSPDPLLDTMKPGILGVFGSAFHVIQPLVVPGFAFAWLELVSHRSFFPSLLLLEGQKGFSVVHQLLVDMLLFLEPHLRNIALTPAIKKLYEGTLRVVLVLLHDFPLFLSGYHLSLCNVIPENCVQLRNVVLSAVPKGINLTDPFTPNLKI